MFLSFVMVLMQALPQSQDSDADVKVGLYDL